MVDDVGRVRRSTGIVRVKYRMGNRLLAPTDRPTENGTTDRTVRDIADTVR